MVMHSHLFSCLFSEADAMVEGAVRHGTAMPLGDNYVSTTCWSWLGWYLVGTWLGRLVMGIPQVFVLGGCYVTDFNVESPRSPYQ